MKSFVTKIIFTSLLLFVFTANAKVENNYHFTSPQNEMRFQHLIGELRCLVCQNQSLAESNAPLALDLKREVYLQMNAGFSDAAIKHYLVQRYGDYILFKPAVNKITFVLWLGPMIFLGGAFLIMYLSIIRQSRSSTAEVS